MNSKKLYLDIKMNNNQNNAIDIDNITNINTTNDTNDTNDTDVNDDINNTYDINWNNSNNDANDNDNNVDDVYDVDSNNNLDKENKESNIVDEIIDVNPTRYSAPLPPANFVDYSKMCDTVINNINKLNDENATDLKKVIIKDITIIKNKLLLIKQIGENFSKKDLLISSFAKTARNFTGEYPYTKGDFDRKYIECPRALCDYFADNVFGNPIGIPIIFIFDKFKLHEFINFMEKMKDSTLLSKNNRLKFGSYRLDKIYRKNKILWRNNTTEQTRYVMILTDVDTSKSIKCYAVNKKDYIENSRVENIDYIGPYIYDALPDMTMRKVVTTKDISGSIFMLKGEMVRKKRVAIFELILDILVHEIQLLEKGYRYIDVGSNMMIKYDIEDKDVCPITQVEPSYINVHLVCDHKISIMALYGVIYQGESNDTESIVCPHCRKNMIPKLVPIFKDNNEYKKYSLKSYDIHDIMSNDDTSEYIFESNQNKISKYWECDDYINEIFRNRESNDSESDNETNVLDDNTIDSTVRDSVVNYFAHAVIDQMYDV